MGLHGETLAQLPTSHLYESYSSTIAPRFIDKETEIFPSHTANKSQNLHDRFRPHRLSLYLAFLARLIVMSPDISNICITRSRNTT